MSRVFMSHSSLNNPQAVALRRWLVEQDPGLAEEIFLDLDPDTGIAPGERWKEALRQANERCEAVICLLSAHWNKRPECLAEYRTAEYLGKLILCARLEPEADGGITREWQRCDLFGDGPATAIPVDGRDRPVVFLTEGLQRLYRGLRKAGIGAEHFAWPPPNDPDRAPYRGWEPLEEADAAVFFGRDGQIVRGLDALRRMRNSGVESLFVVLGPSGTGKSSFLRAGLLPRLRRDDREFLVLDIVRPERNVLTGDRGLAPAIHALRTRLGLRQPTLGEIKAACTAGDAGRLQAWLAEARQTARSRLLEVTDGAPAPTVVLPLDQAEELFSADAGPEAPRFLGLIAGLLHQDDGTTPPLILAGTIRADFYEKFQTAPDLAELKSVVFDELKPMPVARFREVILGPADRASKAGRRLEIEPALVDRLLEDCIQGADTLPLLSLTLARLYRDFGSDGNLTLAEYEAMGGMHEVVQHEIDALLSGDPGVREQQLDQLHSAFIPWLATINPDSDQPTRRISPLADLPPGARPLIDAMVKRRLLVRDDRDGETVIEVALESLLRQWEDLAGWLTAQRKDLKEADSLERAAAAWEGSQRHDAWLLEGERLAGAESVAAKPGFRARLNPTREFLLASRKREEGRAAAEKRRQETELRAAREKQEAAEAHAAVLRRGKDRLWAALAVAVLSALLAIAGLRQASTAQFEADRRAREATALQLAAEGQAMLGGTRPGGGVRAIQQILAAHALAPAAADTAVMSAVITHREVQKVLETGSATYSVAFGPDGRQIVSGGDDGTVRRWDTDTGQALGEPLAGHEGPVRSVAVSPDGLRIVSGGNDGTVRLWDAVTGDPLGEPLRGHGRPVWGVAFSPDGLRIVSGGVDGTVRLWEAGSGRPLGEPLPGQEGAVWTVAFSPDGLRIVSGGSDGRLRQWEAASGRPLGEPLAGHMNGVWDVAFSPNGLRIVSGGNDGAVRLWDAGTGQPLGDPLTGHGDWVQSVAVSPDGHRIVSGGNDGAVRLWDAVTGRPLGELSGHRDWVQSVAFSPDGHRIVSGGNDGAMRLWDADTGPPMIGHDGQVSRVAFSPDGHRIVSGGADSTLRLWDPDTGRAVGEPMTGHTEGVLSVAFSPDGRRIVSGGADSTLRLWDAETRQPVGEPMTGHTDWVLSVAFSPDGRHIVSGGADSTLRLWDAETRQPVGEPMTGHDGQVPSVAFSPDGRHIVSGGYDTTLRLWDAETRQAVGEPMTGHTDWVLGVAFSPDGRHIVSGGYDRRLRLWDAETRLPVGDPMTGHTDWVSSVAFSPDGRHIISGGYDRRLRLWDAETRLPVGDPMTGHTGWVSSVAFSPDGRHIISGGADSTVRLWPVPDSWTDALCAKLTQNMSHQQWSEWVSADIGYREICPGLPIPAR